MYICLCMKAYTAHRGSFVFSTMLNGFSYYDGKAITPAAVAAN